MGKNAIVVAVLLAIPAIMQGVIVDRVAVAVGNKVITQSEIEERIRLTAFQNDVKPDFSLASRREAAQRLIDQRLIEREMDVGHFPRATEERGHELLADYQQSHFPVGRTAMLTALRTDGLAETDLEEDLMRQSDLLMFLNLRFRPAVQVDDKEVQRYFDEKIPSEEKQKGGLPRDNLNPPESLNPQESLNKMRPEIEQILGAEQADRDLDAWLKEQRQRLKVEYVDKDLAEANTPK
jgi:hypothetical protein